MGIFDKAKDMLGEHNEKVDQAIDKVADLADAKTGSQHSEQIDAAAQQIKQQLDNQQLHNQQLDNPAPPQG